MELFRDIKIDWLGKKWYFLGFSLIFSVAGLLSILFWHHIPLGIDFKGGTQIRVEFSQTPNEDHVRAAMDKRRRARLPHSAHQRSQRPRGQQGHHRPAPVDGNRLRRTMPGARASKTP